MKSGSNKDHLKNLLSDLGIGTSDSSMKKDLSHLLQININIDVDEDTMMSYVMNGSIKKLIDQYDAEFHDRLKAIIIHITQSYDEAIKDVLYLYLEIDPSMVDGYQSKSNAIIGYIESAKLSKKLKELESHRKDLESEKSLAKLFPATGALFAVQLMKLLGK